MLYNILLNDLKESTMKKSEPIQISYKDVADYYGQLIRNGATEFAIPFNLLKDEGLSHKISIQIINRILENKYNPPQTEKQHIDQIREELWEEKNQQLIKLTIFNYYSQMLNSFKDEQTSIKSVAHNTGLSEKIILHFLLEYNERLRLNYSEDEVGNHIRQIFEKIWG